VTATVTNLRVSPYKGLANYSEQDAALFFGRDREREVIIANLKARELTLLYGESGVGKSSLLRAGVMSDLAQAALWNLDELGTPEHLPVVFSAWGDEPVAGLAAAIGAAVQRFADAPAEPPHEDSLAAAIDWAADVADAHLLVILDQFEEYFLYHASENGPGTFAAEFPATLNQPGVQANFLVSIREDALAKLDRFKRDIPRLFDSSLRVDHLDPAAAREAIQRPVDHYNTLAAPNEQVVLEDGLVDAVIEQVRSGRVVLDQAGQGTLERSDSADSIETPYLQLVMTRLWDLEEARGSRTLRVTTLAELGGAQEIVRTHLDAALSGLEPQERDTAAALFHQLVTPSGTKIAHAVTDLAEYVRRPEAEVRDLLEKLARPETRILRPIPPPPGEEGPERFEIFHDVLAPSVLAWRTRQTAAKRIEEQRRAARAVTRRRLLRIVGIVAAVGFAAVAVLAIIANAQRNEAQQQESRARELATRARTDAVLLRELAAFDPTLRVSVTKRPSRLLVDEMVVTAPRGAVIAADCMPRGCERFRRTVPGPAPRNDTSVTTIAGHAIPYGIRLRIVVAQRNIGKVAEYRTVRRSSNSLRRTRFERCRPPGSLVAPAEVPAPCP
jgi:energy-coupling factor transporter ATP-binding protein EcfA2